MKMLITPTLLNSWMFFLNATDEWEETAKADFLAMLRRERFQPSEAMVAGMMFEDDVRAAAEGRSPRQNDDEPYMRCVREVADIVAGGTWQVPVTKNIEAGNYDIVLYGKVDVLKGAYCYDIKFTGKYDTGKFRGSAQHRLYLDCLETVPTFAYLVSDGSAVYIEEYKKSDVDPVTPIVFNFLSWMESIPEFGDIFRANWKAKY